MKGSPAETQNPAQWNLTGRNMTVSVIAQQNSSATAVSFPEGKIRRACKKNVII
jgi:hypothetical protein